MADETPGQIVRRARGKLSMDAFAAELGTSRQRVNEWEKGRALPSARFAALIAERAGVSAELFERPVSDPLVEQLEAFATVLSELGQQLRAQADRTRRSIDDRLRGLEARLGALEESVTLAIRALEAATDQLDEQRTTAAPRARATSRRRRAS